MRREVFLPKLGPAPGEYEMRREKSIEITSSLKSETKRFKKDKQVRRLACFRYLVFSSFFHLVMQINILFNATKR